MRYRSNGTYVIDSNSGEEAVIACTANPFLANLIAYRLNQAAAT